ncbi:S-adenosyl-L-methionine-dependent methyltransferase [Testicularia cyperi]|uniref:S-adenosyl-L-methionine-dependent methyltransferase n=1 Tax=Testicularia cyperi TaxID=1882483 RepID=A0A317XIW1_9BASI|nr:S-adenosyl-L-methionine-dependent methyltransferase [Testicularia cyperi]
MSTYHRSENADVYRKNASFVFSNAYTAPVLGLLDPQPGDKILDLGCGSGELTMQLVKAVGPTGSVLGTDASEDMLSKATVLLQNSSAGEVGSVSFLLLDGHDPVPDRFKGKFDKVFSSAALHWMKTDPGRVISNIGGALKPGGRFAAELGGFMNMIGVRSALCRALKERGLDPHSVDPWFFPSPEQYRSLLEANGFKVTSCELVPRLTPLPQDSGIKGWLATFAGPFLNALPDQKSREEVVEEVQEFLRPDCYDPLQDSWSVMYVRLRVLAFLS